MSSFMGPSPARVRVHTSGSGDGSGWVVLVILGLIVLGVIIYFVFKVNQEKKQGFPQQSFPPANPNFPQPPPQAGFQQP